MNAAPPKVDVRELRRRAVAKIKQLPRVLFPAVAGDAVNLPDESRAVVRERCTHFSPRGFLCITHQQPLANEYQLQSHLETAGAGVEHVVASVCAWHGPEELDQSGGRK